MPKANWHQPIFDDAVDDPFALPVERVGVRIELDGSEARLSTLIVSLTGTISDMAVVGVTCPILAMADTSCHSCPISEAGRSTVKAELCQAGRDLETTCTRLAVIQHGRGRE